MIRAAAGIGLAAFVFAAVACGGPDKPPMAPDGPDMTRPVGDDGGAPVTPAVIDPPSAPPSPRGGIENQTSIGSSR